MYNLLKEFVGCFAWDYTDMPGLGQDLVEHALPIKRCFRPYKQPARGFNSDLWGRIKEEVEQLPSRTCFYVKWIPNIVPMEKKNTRKIRVCVDFRNLNRAMPIDEYPMPIANNLINMASGNKVISFLDGNARYN
jgi:hypothetical protein